MLSSLVKSHLNHEKGAPECEPEALFACGLFSGPLFIFQLLSFNSVEIIFLGSATNPLLKGDALKYRSLCSVRRRPLAMVMANRKIIALQELKGI